MRKMERWLVVIKLSPDGHSERTARLTLPRPKCCCPQFLAIGRPGISYESHYAMRSPATFDPTLGLKVIFKLRKISMKFFGHLTAGEGLTLSSYKASYLTAEQTGLRDYCPHPYSSL